MEHTTLKTSPTTAIKTGKPKDGTGPSWKYPHAHWPMHYIPLIFDRSPSLIRYTNKTNSPSAQWTIAPPINGITSGNHPHTCYHSGPKARCQTRNLKTIAGRSIPALYLHPMSSTPVMILFLDTNQAWLARVLYFRPQNPHLYTDITLASDFKVNYKLQPPLTVT